MRAASALVSAILGLIAASPAAAQYIAIPPTVTARWVTNAPSGGGTTVSLAKGQSVNFSALVPEQDLVSAEPFLDAGGKLLIPGGTRFVGADIVWGKNIGLPTACAIERQKGNESHLCLVDRDRDGRFESWMKLYSVSDYFFMSIARPSPKPGKTGIALIRNGSDSSITADVKLFFESRADLAKVNVFHFCVFSLNQSVLGIKRAEPRCSPMKVEVRDDQYPKTFQYLGGSVEFLAGAGANASVRMIPPPAGVPL